MSVSTKAKSTPKVKKVNVKLAIGLTELDTDIELNPYDHVKEVSAWINRELSSTGVYREFIKCIKGPVKLTRMADGRSVRASYSFIMDGKCHYGMDGTKDIDEMYAMSALETRGQPIIVIGGREYDLHIGALKVRLSAADKAIQNSQKKQAAEAMKKAKAQAAEAMKRAKAQVAEAKKRAAAAMKQAKEATKQAMKLDKASRMASIKANSTKSTAKPKATRKPKAIEFLSRIQVEIIDENYNELDAKKYIKEINKWVNSQIKLGKEGFGPYGNVADCVKGSVKIADAGPRGFVASYSFIVDGDCSSLMTGDKKEDMTIAATMLDTGSSYKIVLDGKQHEIYISAFLM